MATTYNYQSESLVEEHKRRVGRGHGSGRVKTGGRGQKGQNARGTMKLDFEGGQLALTKRLPLLRGKLRNKPTQAKPYIVKIEELNVLPKGSAVTLAFLKEQGIVPANAARVKILGKGDLKVALNLAVPCSASVAALVEKAGGSSLVANG